jgi:hypothetical protein
LTRCTDPSFDTRFQYAQHLGHSVAIFIAICHSRYE